MSRRIFSWTKASGRPFRNQSGLRPANIISTPNSYAVALALPISRFEEKQVGRICDRPAGMILAAKPQVEDAQPKFLTKWSACPRSIIMPDKKTMERAKQDKQKGKSPTTQAGEFVREEIHHVREGKHGARSPQQAIAIGFRRRAGPASTCRHPKRERFPRRRARAPRAPMIGGTVHRPSASLPPVDQKPSTSAGTRREPCGLGRGPVETNQSRRRHRTGPIVRPRPKGRSHEGARWLSRAAQKAARTRAARA